MKLSRTSLVLGGFGRRGAGVATGVAFGDAFGAAFGDGCVDVFDDTEASGEAETFSDAEAFFLPTGAAACLGAETRRRALVGDGLRGAVAMGAFSSELI